MREWVFMDSLEWGATDLQGYRWKFPKMDQEAGSCNSTNISTKVEEIWSAKGKLLSNTGKANSSIVGES